MSAEDYLKLRTYLFNHTYSASEASQLILAVISATGARVGEIIGLKWCDIDFERHQLKIQRSFDSAARKIKTTKTVSAIRTIPLVKSVTRLLGLWHENHPTTEFVFAEDEMGLPKASSINSAFHHLQRELGIIPIYSPHSLRHTVASLLVARPELDVTYVSRLLGHSNPSITQRYYLRVLPGDHQREDMVALNTIAL
ncbi:tyrosine-type recombinase/integrase [Lactiplantibacillus plajomi]|uniref:Site-specific integrase n=1 Tax=Lactiplantibacillus plajomi TaxID=1457217 RepID=A0ABV6K1E4_9LACO